MWPFTILFICHIRSLCNFFLKKIRNRVLVVILNDRKSSLITSRHFIFLCFWFYYKIDASEHFYDSKSLRSCHFGSVCTFLYNKLSIIRVYKNYSTRETYIILPMQTTARDPGSNLARHHIFWTYYICRCVVFFKLIRNNQFPAKLGKPMDYILRSKISWINHNFQMLFWYSNSTITTRFEYLTSLRNFHMFILNWT